MYFIIIVKDIIFKRIIIIRKYYFKGLNLVSGSSGFNFIIVFQKVVYIVIYEIFYLFWKED